MAISKLIFNGVIQMDVTGTTAGTGDVASGETFVLADGTTGTGSLAPITVNSLSVTSNGTYTAPTGTAYSPVTVNVSGGGGQYAWAGPNATLAYSFDPVTYKLEDTGFATWTPSTTATTILANTNIGTYTMTDIQNYDYYIFWRFDFVPVYVAGATMQNAVSRYVASSVGIAYSKLSNSLNWLVNGTHNTSNTNGSASSTYYMISYYNSNGEEAATASAYGVYCNTNSTYIFSISGTTLTVKTGDVKANCHATYFSTARAAELDQSKSKFTIKVDVIKTDHNTPFGKTVDELSYIYNNPL